MFQRPVEIGSLLFLSSMVVYVEGNKIQTRVHAEVVDIHTAKRETTNISYFIFKTKDEIQPLGNVVPKTYAGKNKYIKKKILFIFIFYLEAMMYLDGKRHLH
jgi:acyl-coenzyme A thioesterase 9